MKLSIIIPVYNESENIEELYARLKKTLIKDFSKFNYEMLFIDDGSTDQSFSIIQNLSKKDKKIHAIQFSRNFGHHAAISAGIKFVSGNYVVMMDGDLQDRPEEIIKLYNTLLKGYDIVYGIRTKRCEPFMKHITSILFWKLINKISGLNVPENQSMLRIFNKNVHSALKEFKESSRFYAGMFAWVGYKQGICKIKNDRRKNGKSKYSFSKMFALTINATLGFSNLPLYYISYTGIIVSFLAVILGVVFIVRKIVFNLGLIGWPSLFILLSFLGGIIIFSIGVLGIYISKIYQESLDRPLYITRRII